MTDTPEMAAIQAHIQLYQGIFDRMPGLMIVFEVVGPNEFRLMLMNRAMHQQVGARPDDLGKTPWDMFPAPQAKRIVHHLQTCFESGKTIHDEAQVNAPIGLRWFEDTFIPIQNQQGVATHILILLHDITERKHHEQQDRIQTDLISQQAATLAELSTPLLAISETTVVMPVIGAMDTQRAELMMDTLLNGIVASGASRVILDITGMPIVDTASAGMLIRLAQAVRLLGGQIILTGIRPEIAQTMVSLAIDLQGIITRSTLRDGIAYALKTEAGVSKGAMRMNR